MLRRLLNRAAARLSDVPLPVGYDYENDTEELPPAIETAIELLQTSRELLYASGWSSERTGRFIHEFASRTEHQNVPDRPRS